MRDYTYTNSETGKDNNNPNLPELWNDCRNFDCDPESYGCCGIVKKTSVYQYCRRCHESITMKRHSAEIREEYEADDFFTGLVDWSENNDN
jgi:hypothetical protein